MHMHAHTRAHASAHMHAHTHAHTHARSKILRLPVCAGYTCIHTYIHTYTDTSIDSAQNRYTHNTCTHTIQHRVCMQERTMDGGIRHDIPSSCSRRICDAAFLCACMDVRVQASVRASGRECVHTCIRALARFCETKRAHRTNYLQGNFVVFSIQKLNNRLSFGL